MSHTITTKKLSLRSETLRTLTRDTLHRVHGGTGTTTTATVETRLCEPVQPDGGSEVNDTVYRPGPDQPNPPQYNDTVYRGGGSKFIPV